MKSKLILSTVCVATLSLCGCRVVRVCNSDGGMEISQAEGTVPNIRSVDTCFRDGLSVESALLKRNGLGFLVSSVTVRNRHGDPDDYDREDPFAFEYRFTWFDSGGIEVLPDSTSWIRMKVGGGSTAQLSMTAPTKGSTAMVLRLRHAR